MKLYSRTKRYVILIGRHYSVQPPFSVATNLKKKKKYQQQYPRDNGQSILQKLFKVWTNCRKYFLFLANYLGNIRIKTSSEIERENFPNSLSFLVQIIISLNGNQPLQKTKYGLSLCNNWYSSTYRFQIYSRNNTLPCGRQENIES